MAESEQGTGTTEGDAQAECYGCFWDMRPGPWHTCAPVSEGGRDDG